MQSLGYSFIYMVKLTTPRRYKITDYIRNGVQLTRNTIFPRSKRLAQLMIYATNRCQSRCRHCSIWQKPHRHSPKDEIVSFMSSRCISSHTTVGLEGGEFVFTPTGS